jgi:DNA-binding winged helix-turn-helix (wHTH) protein/tetratricopeptide (TPR) repeat protein
MQYRFADLLFDTERGLSAAAQRVALGRREALLLGQLLAADGRVVTKDTLAAALWPGETPSDDSIAQLVRRLRQALQAPGRPPIVQTVYGEGLRLAVPMQRIESAEAGSGAANPAPTTGSAVQALVLTAREHAAQRGRSNIEAARDGARRALELDPRCVPAWCALAEFELMRAGRSLAPAREAGAAAAAAAARALALDRQCGTALAIRGFVRATIEDDLLAGGADLQAALVADPEHWLVRGLNAWVLLAAGRTQQAVDEVDMMLHLNPWTAWLSYLRGQYLLYAGRPAEALEAARLAGARFSDVDVAQFSLSMVSSALGLHDEAIAAGRRAADLATDTPMFHTALAAALARAGREAEARGTIERIEAGAPPLPALWLAPAWWALGDADRALAMLALADRQRVPQRVYAALDPRFVPLLAARRGAATLSRRHIA